MITTALLLLLALVAPRAGAGGLKAVGDGRGASLASWAQAVAPTFAAVKDAALPLGGVGLAEVAQWDFTLTVNRPKLAPLAAVLDGRKLTPQAFAALPASQREVILNEAVTAAHAAATAKVLDLQTLMKNGGPTQGVEFVLRRAEALRDDHAPYLSRTMKAELDALLPALHDAAATEKAARVGARLSAIRESLGAAKAEEAPTAAAAEPAPAAPPIEAVVENLETGRYSLSLARTDEDPLTSLRRDRLMGLNIAAKNGNAAAFWGLSDEAFADLGRRFDDDGLREIAGQPIGPWANAQLANYERQALKLWEEVQRVAAKNGVQGRPLKVTAYAKDFPPVETAEPPSAGYDALMKKIDGAARRWRNRDHRLFLAAVQAGKDMERLQGTSDARLVKPLIDAAAFPAWRLSEARRSLDPNMKADAAKRRQEDRWGLGAPGLRQTLAAWEDAASRPGNLSRLKLAARGWVLAAGLAFTGAIKLDGLPSALAAAAGIAAFILAARALSRLRRFMFLGGRIKAALRGDS